MDCSHDQANHRIRRIYPNSQVDTLAGSFHSGRSDGPGNLATFNGPIDIAIDHNAHHMNRRYHFSALSNAATTSSSSYYSSSADSTKHPGNIEDIIGNNMTVLIVADRENNLIRRIDIDNETTR